MPQGYDEEDFAEMQQQAIRRVREMQQRAKTFSEPSKSEHTEYSLPEREKIGIPQTPNKQFHDEPKPKREQPKLSQQAQRIRQKQHEQKPQGMLSSLFHLDSDVSLILPLLLLLGREGADDILLLALLYIMA